MVKREPARITGQALFRLFCFVLGTVLNDYRLEFKEELSLIYESELRELFERKVS
jgi:hypothetical protein